MGSDIPSTPWGQEGPDARRLDDESLDAMIRGLELPPPPARAPRPTPQRWGLPVALALAAAVLLAVGAASLGDRDHARLRGTPTEAAPVLDLRMAVERASTTMRVTDGGRYHLGERVFFRVSANQSTSAVLWVEGPDGRQIIERLQVGPKVEDVGDAHGLVSYVFDRAGRYTFGLSSEGQDDGPRVRLEVR